MARRAGAVRIHEHGGPEVLRWEEAAAPPPGPGEATLRQTAIGVNYSDVNVRRGGFYLNHRPAFPLVPGNEAAGVVIALGEGVTGLREGDRVAYASMGREFYEDTGAYAEERTVPAGRLVPVPDGVSDQQAAGLMLKGLTASMILNRVVRLRPGDTALIHAAASGVGLILTQWCRHLGATVIGTVGSRAKAELIRARGAAHAVLYRETDFVEAVRRIAPAGVDAVLDGVGQDTFLPSFPLVRPFGTVVNYGNASGHVPPVNVLSLAPRSLLLARPGVGSYIRDMPTMRAACAELFDLVAQGVLTVEIGGTYPLADAAQAHRDLEGRRAAGALLLIP